MVNIADFDKFLYEYLIFLCFFTFLIGLGGGAWLGGVAGLAAPAYPIAPDTGNGVFDFILGTASVGAYFLENIAFFFTLMTFNSTIAALTTLVFTPAAIYIIWGILKLIRGTS